MWEVCFDKSGNFQDVRRAFELKGHTAGVHWFAFSADSYRSVAMSTVSVSDARFLLTTLLQLAKSGTCMAPL